jgi:hypothetical protein
MSQLTLTVAPAQHGRLQDIDDVQPINDRDLTCLAAVRDVLEEYGMRERFGVALLHKHFDMAEDEILVEYTDKEDRVLTIKPVKKDEAGSVIETIWEMGDSNGNKAILGCRQYCGKDIHGNHNSFHGMT